jgi:hypothetical protein
MPIKWRDKQGVEIVNQIEAEYEIPIDGMSDREGVYCRGWAYRKYFKWHRGSAISIYEINDPDIQNHIIRRIRTLQEENNYTRIKVIFYEKSLFTKRENGATRIPAKVTRTEILK